MELKKFPRKALILKHVAQENLGSLLPVLRDDAWRLRYLNFGRKHSSEIDPSRYSALIVLGGHMGVYESDTYSHLKIEFNLIERALKEEKLILGICLGAQILAHVLGARVEKHSVREIGWQEIALTPHGQTDTVMSCFSKVPRVFQMHGDTFSIPPGARHLSRSQLCENQAFAFSDRAYGFQFHPEVTKSMIADFFASEKNAADVESWGGKGTCEKIKAGSEMYLRPLTMANQAALKALLDRLPLAARSRPSFHSHGKAKPD